MASNGNGNHYSNLSRKELQSLCKRHGLPANRSNSDLASSLAPYLECPTPLQDAGTFSKNLSFTEDDGTKNMSINGIETSKANVSPAKEDYDSLSIRSEEAPHLYMEFHTWDNGGINLVVDLKASPPDWIKMFKDECAERLCESIPQSPREDLGYLDENDKERESSALRIIDVDELDDKLTGYNLQHQGDKTLVSALKEPCGADASAALPPSGSISIKRSSGADNGGLVNLSALNLDSNGNTIPAIVEEQGEGKYEGKENSKSSHLDNSVEMASSRCLESEKVPNRKRKDFGAADQCANDNPTPKIDAVYQRRTSRFKSKGFFKQ